MATKKPTTALTVWEQDMAQAAVAQGDTEVFQGGFKSIKLAAGQLSVDDVPVDGNEMRVIILSSVHENQLYEADYDPGTKAIPICFSFGDKDDEMVPHEASESPQHQNCEECPHNQWGSAEKGKGKACKNVRRLICITEDALESAEALGEAEARMLKLPVMSVKNWTAYVKNVLAEEVKRPSWGVVTTIKVVPDPKSQFRVQFKLEELVDFDQELYDAMKKRVMNAVELSTQPYTPIVEEAKPAKPAKKGAPIIKKSSGVAPKANPAAATRGKSKY